MTPEKLTSILETLVKNQIEAQEQITKMQATLSEIRETVIEIKAQVDYLQGLNLTTIPVK